MTVWRISIVPSSLRARPSYRSRLRLGVRGSRDSLLEEIPWQQRTSWMKKSRQACQQASRLDSKLSSAHSCLGTLSAGTGNYQEAAREFERAALRPSLPTMMPFRERAFRQAEKAEIRIPGDRASSSLLGLPYNWLGQFYYRPCGHPRDMSCRGCSIRAPHAALRKCNRELGSVGEGCME